MEMMDHPFIMKYFGSFKDDYNIYLMIECINGMELFEALKLRGVLKPE